MIFIILERELGVSRFSSPYYLSSYYIHLGAQLKPYVSYWTAHRPLVGGGRKRDGKEGNPGREGKLMVIIEWRVHSLIPTSEESLRSFPSMSDSVPFIYCKLRNCPFV